MSPPRTSLAPERVAELIEARDLLRAALEHWDAMIRRSQDLPIQAMARVWEIDPTTTRRWLAGAMPRRESLETSGEGFGPDRTHGSISLYRAGCECPRCVDAYRRSRRKTCKETELEQP